MTQEHEQYQHEILTRLEDNGEYGSGTQTDWLWCATCGAVKKIHSNVWSRPADAIITAHNNADPAYIPVRREEWANFEEQRIMNGQVSPPAPARWYRSSYSSSVSFKVMLGDRFVTNVSTQEHAQAIIDALNVAALTEVKED